MGPTSGHRAVENRYDGFRPSFVIIASVSASQKPAIQLVIV
jgi:hypothetical protein